MSQDAGAARWLSIHDDLLRGLAHALSNRVGTISAISTLLDATQLPSDRLVNGLRAESEQLEAVLHQIRALPLRADAVLEPLILADGVTAALNLFAHHPAGRDLTCTVVWGETVSPVLADPTNAAHAICVALLATAALAPGRSALRVAVTDDGDQVRLDVSTDMHTGEGLPDIIAADLLAIDWLLASSGGRGALLDDGCQITLPTLQAARRKKALEHGR